MCFKQDVEATVNLRYITSGSLKTSRHDFDPESGQIKISLKIQDPRWQPDEMSDNWKSTSRTFVEVIFSHQTGLPSTPTLFRQVRWWTCLTPAPLEGPDRND